MIVGLAVAIACKARPKKPDHVTWATFDPYLRPCEHGSMAQRNSANYHGRRLGAPGIGELDYFPSLEMLSEAFGLLRSANTHSEDLC